MDDLIVEIQKNSRILEFSFVEGTIKLHADDIIYIETARHKNIFYTEKGCYRIYKKLDELEAELKKHGVCKDTFKLSCKICVILRKSTVMFLL